MLDRLLIEDGVGKNHWVNNRPGRRKGLDGLEFADVEVADGAGHRLVAHELHYAPARRGVVGHHQQIGHEPLFV